MDYSSFNIAKDTEAWWKASATEAGIRWAEYLQPTSGKCAYDFYNDQKDLVLDVKWHPTPMGRINSFYVDYIERGSWGWDMPTTSATPMKKHSTVFSCLDKKHSVIVILQAGWAYILNAKVLESEAEMGRMIKTSTRLKTGEWQCMIKCGNYGDNAALIAKHKMNIELWNPTCKESKCLNMNKWMVGEAP